MNTVQQGLTEMTTRNTQSEAMTAMLHGCLVNLRICGLLKPTVFPRQQKCADNWNEVVDSKTEAY